MKFFEGFNRQILVFFFGLCCCIDASYAQDPFSLQIDGNSQGVLISNQTDPGTGNLQIIGSYGTDSPTKVTLTDPSIEYAYNPVVATSTSPSANIKAAALWNSYKINGKNQRMQVALATSQGWDSGSVKTFEYPLEIAGNTYQITISADGQTIIAVWQTFVTGANITTLRRAQSLDGGQSWSSFLVDEV